MPELKQKFKNLPVQSNPDPVNPFLQVHEKESELLIQEALWWHGLDIQWLISKKYKESLIYAVFKIKSVFHLIYKKC